ncbi:MAG: hypothetical protein OEV30_01620 [Ignavibacteria bacterium]|nr:hypothetical protein [Ignavibacteria bacterium]
MSSLKPAVVALAILMVAGDAFALPKFSARTGWKCQSCHVNPSGGGMRHAGGVRYGREELPVTTWSEDFSLEDFTNDITDFVSVGTDVRTLFFYQQEQPDDRNAFFQMQGDIYINLKIARKVNVYFDKGIYSGFELFGQVNILPSNGFVKAGKFVPNFGTKVDEHRSYIREFTGLSLETGSPYFTGAEVGVSPGGFTVTGGAYNASEGRGAGIDSRKAVLGRVEGIFGVTDDLNLGLGANILYKAMQGGKTNFIGGFGSVSIGNFTVLGEADLLKTDVPGTKTDALVVFAEADYMVIQGVDLKFIYDFYDPDLDVKSGTLSRYSMGFEFFPIPGVEVRPLYRILKEEPSDSDNNEFHLLLHFYL